MKKLLLCLVVLVVGFMFTGQAQAEPKDLPAGALVSATLDKATGLATVTVTGVKVVKLEYYAWDSIRVTKGNSMTVPVKEGRRFNFVFEDCGKEYYALVTPADMKSSPAWFGPGIGAECTNPDSCALLITVR